MVKSPNLIICATFSRWWMIAWNVVHYLGLSLAQKYLEDHPSFSVRKDKAPGALRPFRYAARSRRDRNGEINWSLLSDPGTEVVDDCWPDVKA